jgi:hypothetical protein
MNSQLSNKRMKLICIEIDAHMHTLTVTHRVLHSCVSSARLCVVLFLLFFSYTNIDYLLFSIILSRLYLFTVHLLTDILSRFLLFTVHILSGIMSRLSLLILPFVQCAVYLSLLRMFNSY